MTDNLILLLYEMAKAKGPKPGLSFLNSFQICRPKNPSSMIKSPLPAVPHMFSPVNSKSLDISFPSFPIPPPSTPTKIAPSKSCTAQGMTSILSNEFRARNKENKHNSHVSSDSNEIDRPIASSTTEKKKKDNNATKKSEASVNIWGDCDENDNLFSHPSFKSSHDFGHLLKTMTEEEPLSGSKKAAKQTSPRARRFKSCGPKEWKQGSMSAAESKNDEKKVNQSFVVVKRSVDPYEDFKTSMLEMIMEKQMFEPKELEQLLMSFLSLNSRMHHKVIIEAFTEILKQVF